MSVRRLSPNQPASFAFKPATLKAAQGWMANFPPGKQQSAVVPVLWLVQKQDGWISEPAIRAVAELLGMPVIRVLEVATFYTMFMLEPVGTHALVQVCGTTPCQSRGAEALMAVCKRRIGPQNHKSADGKFYWQEVECLGACSNAPMAAINDYYYEDLTPESLEALLDDFAAGKTPKPGSAIGRQGAAPQGGPTTLTDPKLYDGSLGKKIKIPHLPPKAKKETA
ncbi:NADH-quinone oxidoreductase subunit NuoE [Phenylobacterium sp. SCN 70-31]|uniref:NADH-quinone oxidoreductase subunit NuoE n=1 Tax=Phenylobacterium sp. SCN 70-31 TaxID=1660129 RepID=UPI00086D805B|nr:NADH-quinone oxidoreductase subunit NuoE [Phenylobacterium sp. SCN 70-31]ODT87976.1 MAG: NADH-quinone oxidoreductase subunit E [Phenylobacterium sp. SCN 70-31]